MNHVTLLLVMPLLFTTVGFAETPRFKVMTYNIRFDAAATTTRGNETPWNPRTGKARRDMVLQVIANESPALLALQEALPHQVDDVKASLPKHEVYSVGREDGERAGEHCSIFYDKNRFDKLDEGTFWLCEAAEKPGAKHPDAACPRIASWVRLRDREADGREFVFLNTHWDHVSRRAREYAAGAIVARGTMLGTSGRMIVVGDMNAHSDSPEITQLLSSEQLPLHDAYRLVHPTQDRQEATFNGFRNLTEGERIDYVLHTPHFTPLSARIVRTTIDGKNPSDHYPVVVELQ